MGEAQMKLIDTSSWIEYLRGRNNPTARRVQELVRLDEAGWCELVAVELWNGVRPGPEVKALEELEEAATLFSITTEVWQKARRLASLCRQSGLSMPVNDIIISACSLHYGLEIEARDAHFAKILPHGARL